MRILFFTHYYPPEVNAPAARTYEHCTRWAEAGHDVTVVTCVPNCPDGIVYAGYRNRWRPQFETVDGVHIVRVWTYLAPNAGTLRRISNFLAYMMVAAMVAMRLPRPDVVIATSPQFFCGWAGVIVARLRKIPFLLEIRDIWPESIEVVGAMRNRLLLRILEWLERRMYRSADHIVTVGNGYRDRIIEKVGVGDRISVITNGVDLDRFAPTEPDARFLHLWDLEGKFVCSYIGTLGMAHGLDVVVRAARLLCKKGRNDIRFCLVGDGASRQGLEGMARQAGVEDLVVFTGRVPREQVPGILASSDACLIHLKKCELFGTVIPSKIFETMAMGRPMIMGVEGEAREIVLRAGAGLEMEPDSAESLAWCVETMADHPELTLRLGSAARSYVAERYSRDVLAGHFLQLLHQVAGIAPDRASARPALEASDVPAEANAVFHGR